MPPASMHISIDPFRADCDRIQRSAAFRALAGKTQVVPLPRLERLRTRITHVLEVSAIARSIARALGLDESLAEAIALAHDMGHPPFGHVGERVLAHLAGHFHHAAHGVRIVETLEPLGLSPEVRAGILIHSKGKGTIVASRLLAEVPHATREAIVVRVADLIAYASHDSDDAAHLGFLSVEELPEGVVRILDRHTPASMPLPLRIATSFARDVVDASSGGSRDVRMSDDGEAALSSLRALLYARFYERDELLGYVPVIERVIATVFEAACKTLAPRDALDAVASMTDRSVVEQYERLTRRWVRIRGERDGEPSELDRRAA
jgi:dGTPase